MKLDTAVLMPLIPVLVFAVLLIAWCLVDIARKPTVRHLPKWAWTTIVLLAIPPGAVLYLIIGRERSRVLQDEDLR